LNNDIVPLSSLNYLSDATIDKPVIVVEHPHDFGVSTLRQRGERFPAHRTKPLDDDTDEGHPPSLVWRPSRDSR
jgi:hypothetical protein